MRNHILLASVLLAVFAGSAGAGSNKPNAEVFFDFDSARLSADAQAKLDATALDAKQAIGAKIVISGHTDPVGSSVYNVKLSIRRAEGVRDQLLAQGVDPDDIVMAYFGEDGPRRGTFAQDRRVSVELTRDPLYVVIDNAQAGAATAITWRRPATTAEIEGFQPTEQTARR